MKKTSLLIVVTILISILACKNPKKDDSPKELYAVSPEAVNMQFTAYKTTDKLPVHGTFTTINFANQFGATPKEALNNLSFSIPVQNVFTKDSIRDGKLKASFFGAMLNTEFIKGTIKLNTNESYIELTFNNETHNLPITYTLTDSTKVTLTGTLDLKTWHATAALESLHKVCELLHKGGDNVSKTWDDVAIEANINLTKESK